MLQLITDETRPPKGKIKLIINRHQRIELWLTSYYRDIDLLSDQICVQFFDHGKRYEITTWSYPYDITDVFSRCEVIASEVSVVELQMVKGVHHGYLLNAYYASWEIAEAKKLIPSFLPEDWCFNQYVLCTGRGDGKQDVASWLYAQNGKIYFELTPLFHDIWYLAEKQELQKEFKEFMATYKPILKIQISKKVIAHWVQKIKRLEKKLQKSADRAYGRDN